MIDLAPFHQVDVVSPHLHFLIETTSWALRTPNTKLPLLTVAIRNVYKSILQLFNVHSVQNGSPELTTYVLTCVLIPMSGLSFVQSVAKHLLANMIGKDTKAYIQEKRNLSARASLSKVASGVAVGDSHVQMRWADISVLKQVGYVSNLFLMKRL
jgi:hypothetical protein